MAYTSGMESISRNVSDLTSAERKVYETVLGHQLHAGQKIIVQLIDVDTSDAQVSTQPSPFLQGNGSPQNGNAKLPEWCNVFRGLSEQEVKDVEVSILARSPASRNIDIVTPTS